jgi:hypothetical protein
MFEIKFDLSDLEKKVAALGTAVEQIPFTLSLALNTAVKNTKEALVRNTWPQHVTQRNAAFINRALQIDYSKKYNLRVEIYDDLGRANLSLHLFGGTASPRSGRFAIPSSTAVTKTAQGVRSSQRPRAITNSFVANLRGHGDAVWKRVGGRNLKLMYVLKPSNRVLADVPFENDFRETMADALRTSIPAAMVRAMRTRR